MRKTLLLSLLLLVCGVVANAQDYYSLTFTRTGTRTADVKVTTNGGSDAVAGVTATMTEINYDFTTGSGASSVLKSHSEILCPGVNATNNPTITMTFEVTGLPSDFVFDRMGLDIHALNGVGNYQLMDDGRVRQWNVAQTINDASFGTLSDIDIAAGVGASENVHQMWETSIDGAVLAGNPLKIKLTITKGATNNGCFFGLSEIRLYQVVIPGEEEVEAALAMQKGLVGYSSVQSAYDALQTALDAYRAGITSESALALKDAFAAFNSAENKLALEDGAAYTITNIRPDNSTKQQLLYTEAGGLTVGDANTVYDGPEAKFICRKVGDRYVFVFGTGKYMMYKGLDAESGTNGAADTYEASKNNRSFHLLATSNNSNTEYPKSAASVICFQGRNGSASRNSTIVIGDNKDFGGHAYEFYSTAPWSNLMLIEKVDYPNTPNLGAATGIEGIDAIGTFSAPFATVAPEGVTAYYGTKNGDYVTLQPIASGEAIPANQGVVLTGSATGKVTMVPAATETVAVITDNALSHTASGETQLTSDDYILANKGGVGFYKLSAGGMLGMNKAYIAGTTGGAVLRINFGGDVTGIEDALEADDAAAPVYDLAGRKVSAPVKGGIYVKNGKKIVF